MVTVMVVTPSSVLTFCDCIDLDEGMDKVREILSQYPIKTRLNLKGTLIVARDIAHARIKQMLDEGKPMPEYFITRARPAVSLRA